MPTPVSSAIVFLPAAAASFARRYPQPPPRRQCGIAAGRPQRPRRSRLKRRQLCAKESRLNLDRPGPFTGTPTKAGHPAEEIYELSVEAG